MGFAALAFAGLQGYPRRSRQLILGLLIFGIIIEYAQHLTGWRQGDWADWLADCLGVIIASVIWRAVVTLANPDHFNLINERKNV